MNPSATLPVNEKVNIIFDYLFSGNKAQEEEFFWNQLNQDEIAELKQISKEKTTPLIFDQ